MTDEPDELAALREEIDRLDERIADLVAERVDAAEAVADVKSRAGRDLVDEDREAVVEDHHASLFEERGLDPADGRELAEFLIDVALEEEREVAGRS
ncbi:chorismate mutase [Halosimplex marinum]|uniref:chorismate mutase n=1 Tax=Halosimplex marinum TaxID=3396620 RepID=UPI003F544458